jgi:hypothetical protein
MVVTVSAPAAQDDEIGSERPGISTGSGVVGNGRVQIESGLQHETRNDAGSKVRTLKVPTLLRLGVTDTVELRVEGDTYTREKVSRPGGPSERNEGMAPTSVGMKLRLPDVGGPPEAAAALTARFFPRSGSGEFRSSHATGDLRLVADWDLAPGWSFTPNIGIGVYEDDDRRRYTTGLFAASVSHEVTQALTVMVDSGYQSREQRNGKAGALLDVGASYLVNRDTQLDVSAGGRVSGTAFPRRMLSIGLSRRF